MARELQGREETMKRQVTIRSNKGYMEQKEAGTKRNHEATRKARK